MLDQCDGSTPVDTLLYLLGGAQPGQRIKDPKNPVAPWDAIFRSWTLLGRILRYWLCCLSSWLVFMRLGTFRSPFWHAPGASGVGLGGPRDLLFEVFSCLRTYTVQKLRIRKNCSFSLVFPMFFAHGMRGAFTKNSEKSIQEPFERHCSRQPHQNLVLGVPGLDFGGL